MSLGKIVAGMLIVPAITLALVQPVSATAEGQIEGGNIYRVKNVTKNIDFTDPASADKCDVLQYKVRIHNPGPGTLSNVHVQVTLPSGASTKNVSTVTVSASNADPASTSDTATVNLSSSQSLSYISDSTELLDANGNFEKSLSDGITNGGVNIGNVGVSIHQKRFVQFEAKVSCQEQPAPTPTPVVKSETSELPNTGAGAVFGLFIAATVIAALGHLIVRRIKN